MIMIRMARGGKPKKGVYTLVASKSRSPRDSNFLEKLGQYDPKELSRDGILRQIKVERIQHWVGQGATLSPTLKALFKKHKINFA